MKKFLIIACCLFVFSCQQAAKSKFIGKWTDGKWRHIEITADNNGFTVEDFSGGDVKYKASLVNNNELMVKSDKGNSIFNYIDGADKLYAGVVEFHREN